MKGKGHEVTARNIALDEDNDLSRPLTKDEMDNAVLLEEDEESDQYDSGWTGLCD